VTRDETVKILSVLRGAYPQFYKNTTRQEAMDTINLWAEMFADDDYQIVAAAVKSLIASDEKGFPPVIGQVKAKIRLIAQPEELSESDAWNLVSGAIRNGVYGSVEEFALLPENVQRIVGSPAQLRDWATMDSDTVHSVVASNFQRAYRSRQEQRRQFDALPGDVRNMLETVSKKLLS